MDEAPDINARLRWLGLVFWLALVFSATLTSVFVSTGGIHPVVTKKFPSFEIPA